MEKPFCRNGVACKPLQRPDAKKVVRAATNLFGDQGIPLIALEVVFLSKTIEGRTELYHFNPGDLVYIRADRAAQPWAKENFSHSSLGDGAFVVVPFNEIV